MARRTLGLAVATVVALVAIVVLVTHHGSGGSHKETFSTATTADPTGYPGMPAVVDPANIYSEIGPSHLSAQVADQPARVYVPNGASNTVSVIDALTKRVVATVPAGAQPQHVVVSYDLRTLWLLNNQGNSVTPIDPATATFGKPITVDDPYNMYFTPDGASAIVVAEARERLDFRDPHTMALTSSLKVPGCNGINHADYDARGHYALVTCEFAGSIAKVDVQHRTVVGLLDLTKDPVAGQPSPGTMVMPDGMRASSMPQDVRTAPDGKHFYVADMLAAGVFYVNGDTMKVERFIPTGVGAHGLTPSRDGKVLYIANRGSTQISGAPHGPGSVSVLDLKTNAVTATWAIPGGGSPDMGNLNASGSELWLSGRYDSEVYVFDTVHGGLMTRIPVGHGPHGLTVWPQAGRYSLGHTGNMR